jgi:hypothetical protein
VEQAGQGQSLAGPMYEGEGTTEQGIQGMGKLGDLRRNFLTVLAGTTVCHDFHHMHTTLHK